jgi:hypothetical protein
MKKDAPCSTVSSSTMGLFTLFCLLALPPGAHSQGCDQCREAVGQTPARTQSAYRKAIVTMVFAGASVFTAAVLTLRRYR